MRVQFDAPEIERERQSEIESVLQRIAIGSGAGRWPTLPEEIRIVAKLAGGRSGAEVLDAVVRRGNQEMRKVIKLGPYRMLQNEFAAYENHLRGANRFFVPIEAVTPALLPPLKGNPRRSRREAVVYDHASRFSSGTTAPTSTLEQVAAAAIAAGGPAFEALLQTVGTLLDGIRNDLYEKEFKHERAALHDFWNLRLGEDAVVEVDVAARKELFLEEATGRAELLHARDLELASVRLEDTTLNRFIELPDCVMVWEDDRLLATAASNDLRVRVVGAHMIDIRTLAGAVKDGSSWTVLGRIVKLRSLENRRLIEGLAELTIEGAVVHGPGAHTADPFCVLPDVLEPVRESCVTSLAHGDLNARNVLVVGDQPCLIDYALTKAGEPLFADFVRLECSLVREALPDFSWAQHVRLQRLLALATLLGDAHAALFSRRLADDLETLGRAFDLCWTIRRAARKAYLRTGTVSSWASDYVDQHYLFAHLTLKWQEQTARGLRASAAMAAAGAEAHVPESAFRHWDEHQLLGDAIAAVEAIDGATPNALAVLAGFAQRIAPLPDAEFEALPVALARARGELVRANFWDRANETLVELEKDHDVYVQLTGGQAGNTDDHFDVGSLATERTGLLSAANDEADILDIIDQRSELVLLGDAGAGKTTVARERAYRLAEGVVRAPSGSDGSPPPPARMPLQVRASKVASQLRPEPDSERSVLAAPLNEREDWFAIGAFHVIVDALNELGDAQRKGVAQWIVAFRNAFPATPVLVCHRKYNYRRGLLPFPVVSLRKLTTSQARQYIHDYLRENGVPDWERRADALVRLVFESDEYEEIRDLFQTPLFLWMLVERYRAAGDTDTLPTTRGALFEDFSRWYLERRHHEKHGEEAILRHSYRDKALLLGRLGSELVRQGETEIDEDSVGKFAPKALRDRWPELLAEIVAAEMLQRESGKLLFLHQSFQDYFAARYFLETEADDETIRLRVREPRWDDMFIQLIGFGGDRPDVIRKVIQEALRLDEVLTARCLRMVEEPDPDLIRQFIAAELTTLRDAQAGEFLHRKAAMVLGEYSSPEALAVLHKIASSPTAPVTARVFSIERLSHVAGRPGFEHDRDRALALLSSCLVSIFDEPAAVAVILAAIAAVSSARIRSFDGYLAELVLESDWPIRHAARDACTSLGLKLTPRQHRAYVTAGRERLVALESQLAHELAIEAFEALNRERVEILSHIADVHTVDTLLEHRFAYGISDAVADLIQSVIVSPSDPPDQLPSGVRDAWRVLIQPVHGEEPPLARWLRSVREAPQLVALASAHRICEYGYMLPSARVTEIIDPSLEPRRLDAVAGIVRAVDDPELALPLERTIRALAESAQGSDTFEAMASLGDALQWIDFERGRRVKSVATLILLDRSERPIDFGAASWRHLDASCTLWGEDYSAMLEGDDQEAAAAVYEMSACVADLLCGGFPTSVYLTKPAFARFTQLARGATEARWILRFCDAAALCAADELLPWMLETVRRPGLTERFSSWNSRFGEIESRRDCGIVLAIGYLASLAKQKDDVANAIAFLHAEYAAAKGYEETSDAEHAARAGSTAKYERYAGAVATALSILGEWEPLFGELGEDEPWLHVAAINFATRLPASHGEEKQDDVERAARYVIDRLHGEAHLSPAVRSTLSAVKEALEERLGYRISAR